MTVQGDLLALLDFTPCRDKASVLRHAHTIAQELIRNWKIVSPAGARRFLGLEFYLSIPGVWMDDAAHCRDEQLESGTFYVHTRSKDPGWSPPIFNRHGVDITCGNRARGLYGGILLRHLSGCGHRDGSGLALRSLVRGDSGFRPIMRGSRPSRWSAAEIAFFRRMRRAPLFGHELYLEYAPLNEQTAIAALPRVGLAGKNSAGEKLRFIRTAP